MQPSFDRTMGLFSSIMIGVGAMIGSGIFVLAGISYEAAGPAASLSFFLAGVAALLTGFSFAELVTIIPRTGGGYAYVREAAGGGITGFLAGWAFWLGYALSCGLFALGFGKFLNYFVPAIPQMAGAYGLIVYVLATNIRGTRKASLLQNVITVLLVLLLGIYIVRGFWQMDTALMSPYFPLGTAGMFRVMGYLYMTYIGYDLITTASEEIVNPEKTIPRAILISTGVAIVIKTASFLVGSGILPWQQLVPSVTPTPLTDTAVVMFRSRTGGHLFALAGIFATLSSINTGVMASSRTSFAMSRDGYFPSLFRMINRRTSTPVFSLLVSGVLVAGATGVRNLEALSTVTTMFALMGYTLVNLALFRFRRTLPDAHRAFRVPLYPLTPILGILVNGFLLVQLTLSDFLAVLLALAVTGVGVMYYFLLLPRLPAAPKGVSTRDLPEIHPQMLRYRPGSGNIVIPVFRQSHPEPLLNFAAHISRGEPDTITTVIYVVETGSVLPLPAPYEEYQQEVLRNDLLARRLLTAGAEDPERLQVRIRFSHKGEKTIIDAVTQEDNPFILVGWESPQLFHNNIRGVLTHMMERIPADFGILRDNRARPEEFREILFPYGGGPYSQRTAAIVRRLARAFGARVTLLRVIDPDTPETEEAGIREQMDRIALQICDRARAEIRRGELQAIVETVSGHYDLLVLGVSLDWGIREYLTGVRTDTMARTARCPVLLVKSYQSILQRKGLRRMLNAGRRFLEH